ncbi:MAG: HAD-IB family phosphatase [Patescibacteria group bacterium]
MKRKVAIFDIDGTIFRSSLLIELVEALIEEGIFPKATSRQYAKAYQRWLDRKDSYEKYISGVVLAFRGHIRGVEHSDFLRVSNMVTAFHKDRVYRYTRDLIKELKHKKYFLLAISNSPKEIADTFAATMGFDKVYGRIYEVNVKKKFTGKMLFEDLVIDKAKLFRRAVEKENLVFKGSIGVGDSEADIRFLSLVDLPICFNPNKKLYEHAKRKGWRVVVERKDMIYTL